MRVTSNRINEETNGGYIELLVETVEDLYQVYVLVCKGDAIYAPLSNQINTKIMSSVKQYDRNTSRKVTMNVKYSIFDRKRSKVRFTGEVVKCTQEELHETYVTLEFRVCSIIRIIKREWNELSTLILASALNYKKYCDFIVILIQPGFAQIFKISRTMTHLAKQINLQSIMRRQTGMNMIDCVGSFVLNKLLLRSLVKHITYNVDVKKIIIASPSTENELFVQYALSKAPGHPSVPWRLIFRNVVLTDSTSGKRAALHTLLRRPEVRQDIKDTNLIRQHALLDEFKRRVDQQLRTATSGPARVKWALNNHSAERILVADSLLASCDETMREKYVMFFKQAYRQKVRIDIISAEHITLSWFAHLYGIGAMLKLYPISDLDSVHAIDRYKTF